jgi:abortive infection bacteriophage resistance protein
MAKKAFDKKPTTYTQQLHLIKCRGLAVPDEAKAIRYLKQILENFEMKQLPNTRRIEWDKRQQRH